MVQITEDIKMEAVKAMQVVLLEKGVKLEPTVKLDQSEEEILADVLDAAAKVVMSRMGF